MTKKILSNEELLFRFAKITICEQARRDFKKFPTDAQIMDIVQDRVMWFDSLPRFNPPKPKKESHE